MSNKKEKSKEKENISIIVDPKTDQFVVYRSGFSIISIFLLSYLLLSCLGNKGVEEKILKETSPKKDTVANSSAENEKTSSNEEDLSNLLVEKEESEEKDEPAKKSERKVENFDSDSHTLVVSKESRLLIKKIRILLYYGNYRRVVAISKKSKDPLVLYYRGIAYYSMMLNRKRYSSATRRNFRDNALSLFDEAAKKTEQSELKSRALLWHAVTLDLNTTSTKGKTDVINTLRDIRQKYPNSSIANDALLYEGDILTSLNRKNEARETYKKLSTENFPDKVVYDRYQNKIVSQTKAVEYGLRRVARR